MLRFALALTLLAVTSSATSADEPKKPIPASTCPDGACSESAPARGPLGIFRRPNIFGGGAVISAVECRPDGCINPIGCGNFHTDFRFTFGSCRSFFGIGGAIPAVAKP